MKDETSLRIALCYDRLNTFGGAERVLAVIISIFPNAEIYTLTHSLKNTSWLKENRVYSSFISQLPFIGSMYKFFPMLADLAWEMFDFKEYDIVITLTADAAKSILVPPQVLHLCYCLTPKRYLWSGYFDYLLQNNHGFFSQFAGSMLRIMSSNLRLKDYYYAYRPNEIISISKAVSKRIYQYYRRPSYLIYPPLHMLINENYKDQTRSEFFLVVSRLVPYKRIDIVVGAFNKLGWPLVIVGDGPEINKLRNSARGNIKFTGFVSDKHLSEYYSRCIALIFPSDDDFGLVPLEAQSYCKPVVAFRASGAVETVIDNKTGIFFDLQDESALIDRLNDCGENLEGVIKFFCGFEEQDFKDNLERFQEARFIKEFLYFIESRYNTLVDKNKEHDYGAS